MKNGVINMFVLYKNTAGNKTVIIANKIVVTSVGNQDVVIVNDEINIPREKLHSITGDINDVKSFLGC